MKTKLTLLLAALVSFHAQAADELTAVLQRGLFNEEAEHDLPAAIKAYQSVVAGADAQRKLAATAVFRLGECYRKLGQTNEAITQYQRILEQFTDQTNLVTLSRQNLIGLGVSAVARDPGLSGRSAPDMPTETVALLKELLQGEIAIAEQLLAEQRNKVKAGVISLGEVDRFARDVLGLKRQLLAVDGFANAEDRKQWRSMLIEEIVLAERAVQTERAMLDAGKSVPGELAKLQRDVFALKRELVTFDAARASGPGVGAIQPGFPLDPTTGLPAVAQAATDEEDQEVRRIQALIKDSPDLVNAKSVEVGKYGDSTRYGTPLHKAAQQGQLVVARFLIDNGADLDSRDGFGRTALHWAALNGHKSMAELLLARGAEPNPGISGSANSGSAGFTPLHLAAQNGYRNVCEALLAGKADLNAQTEYNRSTPVHLAAERGFTSVAELLLAKGAEVNARNSSGSTPLASAAGAGMKNAVQLLLANKADINAQATQGETPLFNAVSGNRGDLVRLLLAAKANPNLALNEKSQNSGWTPLVAAISRDDVPMARLLLENGAGPNVLMYRNGYTVLMRAAEKGSLELAEALIAAGAHVNARDNGDVRGTALHAVTSSNPTNAAAIVELLIKNKADVNVANAYNSTPLIQAVGKRNLDVVRLLVEHGADVNAMTRQGESPLSLIKPRRQQGVGGPTFPAQPPTAYHVIVAGAGQPAQPPPDPTSEIIALLTQRGARDDLQRFSAISTTRNQENRVVWFSKGTNDWNRYTLLDLIATMYQGETSYRFPDFSKIAISRIDPKTSRTEDIRIDLETAFKNKDCTQERPLEWGDIVEVPELDHLISDSWGGLSRTAYLALQICLERNVRVVVKGQATNVVLTPFRDKKTQVSDEKNTWEARMNRFRLNRFLRNSGLLLASSDVTRVKVKRTDPATKQVRERIFNLDQINNTNDDINDLWLRDGDVIEVPEKDANRAAASPRAEVSA